MSAATATSEPFEFVRLPDARSRSKPRTHGLTMMMDWGMPLGEVRDRLELVARYVDLAKFVVGTARLYDRDYLLRKTALYREFGIQSFIGGQFLEYVFATDGLPGAEKYFAEARALGFDAIEVSDNYVPIQSDERRKLVSMAVSAGLHVHGEVGSKTVETDAALLIEQATEFFAAGADVVLVEGAELLIDGKPNVALLRDLKSGLDVSKVIFELSGTWIPNTTLADVHVLKRFLIDEFGPDVNIANVMPDDVWETEALRVALSVVGPTQNATAAEKS